MRYHDTGHLADSPVILSLHLHCCCPVSHSLIPLEITDGFFSLPPDHSETVFSPVFDDTESVSSMAKTLVASMLIVAEYLTSEAPQKSCVIFATYIYELCKNVLRPHINTIRHNSFQQWVQLLHLRQSLHALNGSGDPFNPPIRAVVIRIRIPLSATLGSDRRQVRPRF